ncbi:MAG TPA: hypothetical protein VMR98_05100, partial [Candidatus Polarisedimenticolaceae bacterium]|nr:hypothetical protein [Candidatus Polarisedimenticolaceae bacterium]
MNSKKIIISFLALLCTFTSMAQLGNLRNKVKEKVKETKETTIPNQTPVQTPVNDTKNGSSKESTKTEKDADGFIINDPAVTELLKDKNIYHATDISLFADILGTRSSFKMSGVGVNKTDGVLDLFIVAQRQYSGVLTKESSLQWKGDHYESEGSDPFYAVIQTDGSILIFKERKAELISKDETIVKNAT